MKKPQGSTGLNKKQYGHGFARIKHGFNKWSFKFHFLTDRKFLQFQMAGHDIVFFKNAFIRVESELTPLDKKHQLNSKPKTLI
jgi:hypothetical protein